MPPLCPSDPEAAEPFFASLRAPRGCAAPSWRPQQQPAYDGTWSLARLRGGTLGAARSGVPSAERVLPGTLLPDPVADAEFALLLERREQDERYRLAERRLCRSLRRRRRWR